jgi:hypothetical protein
MTLAYIAMNHVADGIGISDTATPTPPTKALQAVG